MAFVRTNQRLNILNITLIHRNDIVEFFIVRFPNLAGIMLHKRHVHLHQNIPCPVMNAGVIDFVIGFSPGRVNFKQECQPRLIHHLLKHKLCHRRTTNITKTNKENFNHFYKNLVISDFSSYCVNGHLSFLFFHHQYHTYNLIQLYHL